MTSAGPGNSPTRAKSRLAQLHAAVPMPVTPSPVGLPRRSQPPTMESPRGRGMTRRADRHYVQEILRDMGNVALDEPQCQTSTPEAGQYDSADQDQEEDDLAAELDFDSEEYDTEATGNFGRLHRGRTPAEEESCHAKGEGPRQARLQERRASP